MIMLSTLSTIVSLIMLTVGTTESLRCQATDSFDSKAIFKALVFLGIGIALKLSDKVIIYLTGVGLAIFELAALMYTKDQIRKETK